MDQKINSFRAVYLAAGYGSRISSLTENPKCLLEINEETLLERSFRIWKNLGIREVTLVLGYREDLIRSVSKKYENDFNIQYKFNEDFRNQGNTFSLQLGIKNAEEPVLIFDADLIYDEEILSDFTKNGTESEILVSQASINDIECAKTMVDQEGFARMTIDKRAVSEEELKKYQFAGEAIGILKFSKADVRLLSKRAENFLSDPKKMNLNWEHLLNEFLLENKVGVFHVKKGKSVEIDDPNDYQRAKELFQHASFV